MSSPVAGIFYTVIQRIDTLVNDFNTADKSTADKSLLEFCGVNRMPGRVSPLLMRTPLGKSKSFLLLRSNRNPAHLFS